MLNVTNQQENCCPCKIGVEGYPFVGALDAAFIQIKVAGIKVLKYILWLAMPREPKRFPDNPGD